MRQFLEQNLQRFVEFNGGDMGASKGRRLGALRTAVRAGATSSQRELVAALAGTPNQLGAARPLVTWSDARAAERFDGRKRGASMWSVWSTRTTTARCFSMSSRVTDSRRAMGYAQGQGARRSRTGVGQRAWCNWTAWARSRGALDGLD